MLPSPITQDKLINELIRKLKIATKGKKTNLHHCEVPFENFIKMFRGISK